jgi:hypothetical protein
MLPTAPANAASSSAADASGIHPPAPAAAAGPTDAGTSAG